MNISSAVTADHNSVSTESVVSLPAKITQEMTIKEPPGTSSVVSAITEHKDCSGYTLIEKGYFITSNQKANSTLKDRDGDI